MKFLRSGSFGRILLLLPVLSFLLLSGCQSKREAEVLERYTAAVEAGDYSLARDIYTEEKVKADFAVEPFADVMRKDLEGIATEYANGNLSYDQALLALEAAQMNEDLTAHLETEIQEVEQAIAVGDTVDHDLEQAQIFAEAGEYSQALAIYDEILRRNPEHSATRSAKVTVLGQITQNAVNEAENLSASGYPRAALAKIEDALTFDPQNQTLQNLKTRMQAEIDAKDMRIAEEIPKIELNLLLRNGDLTGAQELLDELEENGTDISLLQPLVDERVNIYIEAVLESASSLTSEAMDGRWTQNPYARAISKLNEGLSLYPENGALLAAKAEYQSFSPDNATDDISISSGSVTRDASGSTATGYTYQSGGFDEALAVKPDIRFSYSMGGYTKTRLILSPKTADTGVYNNMEITITVNGETVHDAESFASSLNPIDLRLDVSSNSVVEVRIRQSGFASFFEGIIGRNQVFVELYRYN